MANAKILEQKSLVVDEIKGKFENVKSVVVFGIIFSQTNLLYIK